MKFIPLLLSDEMSRANMLGWKSQTRRTRGLDAVNKNPNDWTLDSEFISGGTDKHVAVLMDKTEDTIEAISCPYGSPGDVIWFREKWTWEGDTNWTDANRMGNFYYASDRDPYGPAKWKPNMHMPAIACRQWGYIEVIRLERLRDISELDAMAEGIMSVEFEDESILDDEVKAYAHLWDKINGKGSWQKNPWVWVVKYRHTEEAPAGWNEYLNSLK